MRKCPFYMILLCHMMNQALAYIMLVAVGVLVVGPLVLYATSSVTSNAMSYQDFVQLQNKRVAQNVVITHSEHASYPSATPLVGEIHIHIVNTGLEDIIFKYVLIDGIPSGFDTVSTDCWTFGAQKSGKNNYCLYNATNFKPLPDKDTKLLVDKNIRIGIQFDTNLFQTYPAKPKTIQLVTDAFKLFEVSIPSP